MSKSFEPATATQNQSLTKSIIEPQELALEIADAAEDKKAADIVLLKVSDVSYLADYFVIITGFSRAQLNAIAESIEERLEEKYNLHPVRISGKREGGWVVQDYADVIVHIFLPEEREYYNLEAFWGHAERHEFDQPS
ncbi:MAG: ribosome silencing factor [Pleurocapsa sp. SU_5_0]|nr:ribosome silencing factor [Pleurocapsa sp. SU_5_0]NJO94713.1 ribosome silencing factor [Pleurocapsa sp. CRU_1_2]NJR45848.1 ribosome silencing factor [Hyellaceae cyanobacterium CSU_1_1]